MQPQITVIAHNFRSAHNVGSLLRTAEGLAVEEVFLTGHSPYPVASGDSRLPHIATRVDKQIDKTALGAGKTQKWKYCENIDSAIKQLKDSGFTICALEQSADSTPLPEFKLPQKIAIILGNEVDGLDQATLKKADLALEIPMFGNKESFNVVQAAAMALYAFRFN